MSGHTRDGNMWVKSTLTEAAWAVSHTKGIFLAVRRGKKQAIIAVDHSSLVIVYHILKEKEPYQELGPDYFDRQNAESLKKRLQSLGNEVAVSAKPAA